METDMGNSLTAAADAGSISRTVLALKEGKVIIYPTDTVYGIGCLSCFPASLDRVFKIKGRDPDKPLPALVSDIEEAGRYGLLEGIAAELSRSRWPGATTLILSERPGAGLPPHLSRQGLVALRVPGHEWLREVIRLSGHPLAGTSANLSGQPPASSAGEIPAGLRAAVDLLVDGGHCGGKPSEIIDCTGPEPRRLR